MACRLNGTMSLSKPMMPYGQLDHKEHISVTFYSKFKIFFHRNALENGGHFPRLGVLSFNKLVLSLRCPLNPYVYIAVFAHHDDVIKRKLFRRYWPFVLGIYRSPVNSPHKGPVKRTLMFLWLGVHMNCLTNSRMTGELRLHDVHVTLS